MFVTHHTFAVCKGCAAYTCPCRECGKTLKRKVIAEHTVNPFNKNDDGSVRTSMEVSRRAQEEAEQEAATKQGVPDICRNCEDAPNRALLLQMAANPDLPVPDPERFWNSPLHFLRDRKHVEERLERGGDGETWRSLGWFITAAGLKRAASLTPTPSSYEGGAQAEGVGA